MALAAVQQSASSRTMNVDGEATGVHPFFTTLRTQVRESPPEAQPNLDSLGEGEDDRQDGSIEEGNTRTRKISRTRKRSPEKGSLQSTLTFERKGAPSEEARLQLATGREDVQDGDMPHTNVPVSEVSSVAVPTHLSQPVVINEATSAATNAGPPHHEMNLSERAHKRQCISSDRLPATPSQNEALHHLGWEEQLLQAGFGDASPLTTEDAKPPPVADNTQRPNVATAPSENYHVDQPSASSAGQSRERTPPKKIIKLRTDGKLVSPQAKVGTGGTRGSKRKGVEQQHRQRAKILVLRYGRDPVSQLAIGKHVNDILGGATRVTLPEPRPGQQSALRKSDKPAKQTHPFFTGNSSRSRTHVSNSSSQALPGGTTSRDEASPTPQIVETTSKKSWSGFGASFSKPQKWPGLISAIWPPNGMVHCYEPVQVLPYMPHTKSEFPQRKLKQSETRLSRDEDVLSLFRKSLGLIPNMQKTVQNFNYPSRKLMTGTQLMVATDQRLSQHSLSSMHPALCKLREEIKSSMSAFDKFECQNQQWDYKYSPNLVTDVLTDNADSVLLKEWLLGLTVNTVHVGTNSGAQEISSRKHKVRAKKKRKVSDGLDDFIVSSEDEQGLADVLTDPESDTDGAATNLPRLSQRNLARTRAVLLVGQHGCGKTAAVYAAARELDFEVFEINPGMRRSGRDILDRVGDMTRNHLVRQLPDVSDGHISDRQSPAPDATAEVESGRQSTMQAFFQPKTMKADQKVNKKADNAPMAVEPPKKAPRKQKQSLILLEEVDTLFEDDKQFWTTVLSLLLSSRRPVVMTCNDVNLLPLQDMADVAYLRLGPPLQTLAVDYLLLLAANEGHLIARSAVERLFHLHNYDLRASIVQLNFLCQMALGDTKGGLEWMLIRSNVSESTNEHGEQLRVVSADTFRDDTIVMTPSRSSSEAKSTYPLAQEAHTLYDIHDSWELEVEDWVNTETGQDVPQEAGLESLRRFEAASDGLSVADILPGCGLLESDSRSLDPTHPPLANKDRGNYVEGYHLLDTPVYDDPSNFTKRVVHDLRLQSRSVRALGGAPILTPELISHILVNRQSTVSTIQRAHSAEIFRIFSPLSVPNPTYLGHTSPSRLLATLPSIMATDVAPYVRSIVTSDLQLERTRLKLSNLISEGGTGGGKTRTTRAARAALEGGKKESTRRERWFRKEVNYKQVLETAGTGWEAASVAELQAAEQSWNEQAEVEQDDGMMEHISMEEEAQDQI